MPKPEDKRRLRTLGFKERELHSIRMLQRSKTYKDRDNVVALLRHDACWESRVTMVRDLKVSKRWILQFLSVQKHYGYPHSAAVQE